jgi:hypothetical protein
VEGDIMRALNGAYSFVEVDGGTQVFYELELELVVPLPGFVKRRAEARILIEAVKELKARAESCVSLELMSVAQSATACALTNVVLFLKKSDIRLHMRRNWLIYLKRCSANSLELKLLVSESLD